MNSAAACHSIEGCPGLFIDAPFNQKTKEQQCCFRTSTRILTHYHADHYTGLPRDFRYQGPALIHCTNITARLLQEVHQVAPHWIVPHAYGETWTLDSTIIHEDDEDDKNETQQQPHALVTFYDANHCPGAAMVLIELPHLQVTHLHTGDFRFHPKMKRYPRLNRAVQDKSLDLVYLDTTYGHPKHEFGPQEQAIDCIARQCHEFLPLTTQPSPSLPATTGPSSRRTLVLLSCYNIGKEKILWEAAARCRRMIYVSERKYKMLQCCVLQSNKNDDDSSSEAATCSWLQQRCTTDPMESDLHVILMGLAGELWPFFQPNHGNLLDYVESLQQDCDYDQVVAFVPTGWANGSNYNKRHAVSRKRLERKEKSEEYVDVEIRLVAYSEHSAFSELCAFVEYLRPRQVIPTVFKDDKDRRQLEGRFRHLIDSTRAKRQFFKSMTAAAASNSKKNDDNATMMKRRSPSTTEADSVTTMTTSTCTDDTRDSKKCRCASNDDDDDDHNDGGIESTDDHIATLVSMGFNPESARQCLTQCQENVEAALDMLLLQRQKSSSSSGSLGGTLELNATNPKAISSPTITHYFSPKKS